MGVVPSESGTLWRSAWDGCEEDEKGKKLETNFFNISDGGW